MKYIKILLLSLVLISANAFALNSPSQIAAMMDSGNLRGAENSLKDVLHSGKDTAKVHYMLAQVYQKEGQLSGARSELARANQMDPEHSYTDNAHYRPIADAINGRVNNTTSPVVMVAAPATPSDNTFFKVIGGIFLIGLLGWFAVMIYMHYRTKREEEERLVSSESQLRTNAALLVQDIQKAILSEKTAPAPSTERMNAITVVNFKALNVYDRVKNLAISNINDIVRLADEVSNIRQTFNEVLDADYSVKATVKVTKTARHTVAEVEETPAPVHTAQAIPAAAPVITQAQPQTVVVGGVNNGLSMTDLLVADMIINEPHRHNDDDYFSRPAAPAPVEPDSGDNDRWDSSSSDSGNDNSYSSSSSDSGSSDSSW